MPAVAFADIGKRAKGLLGGDAATGTFVLNPKLTIAGTTKSGVALTAIAAQKGDKLDASLKAAYTAPSKKYSVDATADPAGKVAVNASVNDVAPGLKMTAAVVLPDPAASAKLTAEYASAAAHVKSTISLSASPVVELAVASAVRGVLVGGETAYDSAKADITKMNFVLGYHAADFQASASLVDQLSTLKLAYAHSLSPAATVGAELTRKVDGAATGFALAYARSLAGGAVAKVKLESSGTLSALYSTKLVGGEKVTGSLQLQATDLSKGPKYGFALDLA
ncbi:Voltage-dependent anion-selective channel protein 2 [Pleodorina starrii]|uniref:Voltage-dependent anion-selective channel protein 2 n=1 Tax=Pleodorina starrii TaxID=330485 RepID=A0A9W6BSA7_9CHLO|nr:Voltage-dependent anion-selective channel protein 2 [Pleodorina starrii]GLC57040.1 Voltage-dependent anion-selective channel protein 2 [Pleodorina starrii]GLC64871.1 Voltage-dependent anion-selective channel protein 2 [Pleodorina starrii]